MASSLSRAISLLSALFCFALLFINIAHAQPVDPAAPVEEPVSEDPAADECAGEFDPKGYNLKLHIGAVFIVLATSALGILGAVFVSGNKYLRKKQGFLFCVQFLKFFGVGVIVATAWIHLLTPAYEAFSNPCLTKHGKWERYGIAYVGLFGMIAAFVVQAFEFCALSRGDHKAHQKAKAKAQAAAEAKAKALADEEAKIGAVKPKRKKKKTQDEATALKPETEDEGAECNIPHTHTHDHETHKPHKPHKKHTVTLHDVTGHSHDVVSGILDDDHSQDEDLEKAEASGQKFATLFLELGILFHSVIIGIALGTSTDEFKSLLVAIVFHQFFEGIALGVRIAEINTFNTCKKVLAAILYPLTTPIGIAVGIGIRSSFNENAYKGLLTQGIFDSLSAGILFYNAYVELIAFEMNRNAVFRAHNTLRKVALFFAVYLGAATMAIIGLWA